MANRELDPSCREVVRRHLHTPFLPVPNDDWVTLHVSESFPSRAGSTVIASGPPVACASRSPEGESTFDVVHIGDDAFAFTGVGAQPILMTVSANGVVCFRHQGVEAPRRLVLERRRPVHLQVAESELVIAQASELEGWEVDFTGAGRVDIRGITFESTEFIGGKVIAAAAKPDVSGAIRPSSDRAGVLVNGNTTDFIKASWVHIERQSLPADSEAGRDYWQVIAKIELALMYVRYLGDGGYAFDDFLVHIELDAQGNVAWRQSLHDNLLGELNASILRARLLHNAHQVPPELALTREGLCELYLGFAGSIADRSYCVGRKPDEHDADCAPLAFDFSQGWARRDYVMRSRHSRLTGAAVTSEGRLWGGKGGDPKGFVVARHEGAGVELGFKVHSDEVEHRHSDSAGSALFYVPAGGVARRDLHRLVPRWSVDFSVCTRLRGVARPLDEFRFVLAIRRTLSSGTSRQCQFELTSPSTLYHPVYGEIDIGRAWLPLSEGGGISIRADGMLPGGFGDEINEIAGEFVSQNVICIGFPFLRRLLTCSGSGTDTHTEVEDFFGPALFEFRLEAHAPDGALLVENQIHVQVA